MDFKVFTLNCWGIPMVSKDRKSRMQAIAETLALSQYDVVCLQEVWTDKDFVLIKEKVKGCLPFSHYFYSGVVGSGICVLSKYPFEDVFFHQWPVNGYIHKLHHGDWFGGKGVGLCRLRINNCNVNVYSAHLHAEYNRSCDEYQAHRVLQAFDTAQFIQLTSGNADLVVLAGDLNTEPGDLAYRIILGVTGLTDAFTKADEIAQQNSATNESLINSYTNYSLIKKQRPGKRIDYIMYSAGSNISVDVLKYHLPLPERVPECSYSYSDHEAVTATLTINSNATTIKNVDFNTQEAILEESTKVCDEAIKRLLSHKRVYWILTTILFILLLVSVATDAPYGYNIFYHIVRVLLTGVLIFTIIMATLWNKIENNAVVAGKLTMEVALKQTISRKAK